MKIEHIYRFSIFILLLFGCQLLFSQVRIPFTPRTSHYTPDNHMYYLKGDYQLIGNTNLTLDSYSATGGNGNTRMVYVDVDNNPSTINSSSAELTFSTENGAIPTCSDIVYAGLYWSGRCADATNGPFSWSIGDEGSNYTYAQNGRTVSCYTLRMENTGSGNTHISTYQFTPDNGGETVYFRFNGNHRENYSLTVQVGNGPAVPYTSVTFPTNASNSTATNTDRTVTFNNPYKINTGGCTIYINSLTKRTSTNLSKNFSAKVLTDQIVNTTVGNADSRLGYQVSITGRNTGSTNTTTYTITGHGDEVVFEFSGQQDNRSVYVKRYGITTSLSASYTPSRVNNNTTTTTATLTTPYELSPGVYITELTKRTTNSIGTVSLFNVKFREVIPPQTLNKNKVLFKHDTQDEYKTVFASPQDIWYPATQDGYMYVAYAEVTDYVKEYGLGNYYVANMALKEGNGGGAGFYGGWGLVVIYQNSTMNWRNITVFDGYTYVDLDHSNVVVNVEGFHTLQTGNVHMKLGVMAGEGDVDISGDFLQIINQRNQYVALSHGGNSTNNFFNSSIYTGNNSRNPNLINNTGIDVSMFEVPNTNNSVITNNQTSTSFRLGSTQDAYVIYALIIGVDAYVPSLDGVNIVSKLNNIPISDTISTLTVHPEEIIEYKLDVRNLGTEPVVNANVNIPIPYTSEYISANAVYASGITGEFNYDPTEGAGGTIKWIISEVPNGTLNDVYATLYYRFKITGDCGVLSGSNCDLNNDVFGHISGEGELSAIPFTHLSFIRGYHYDGECIGEPIYGNIDMVIDATDYIQNNCPISQDPVIRTFPYCNLQGSIPFQDVSGFFPVGSRFYSTFAPEAADPTEGAVEYTYETGFPNLHGSYSYYALFPEEGCYSKFTIEGVNFTATPTVSQNQFYYCQGDSALPLIAIPSTQANKVFYYTVPTGGAARTVIIPSTSQVGNRQYFVAEALSNGCVSTQRVPITVTTREVPAVTLTSNVPNNTICDGSSIVITANTTNGKPYKFAWYNSDPESGTPIIYSTSKTYSAQLAGNYWVKVVDTTTNCYTIAGPLTVTIHTQPILSESMLTLCGGAQDTIPIIVAGNAIGATVSSSNATVATATLLNNSVIIDAKRVTTDDNNTIITYTDGNHCSASLNLTVKTTPVVALRNNYGVCQNSENQIITATVTNIADDILLEYSWNGGAYSSENSSYMLYTSQVGTQTLTVTVKNEDGCISEPATMRLMVRELPKISLSPYSNGLFLHSQDTIYICEREHLFLRVSPLGNSRTWYYPGGTPKTTDTLSMTNLSPSLRGWIKVTVNQGGCVASDSVYLSVCPLQNQPDITLTILNGQDTLRYITNENNPQVDTLFFADSLYGIAYFPPNQYNRNYEYRIFTSMNNSWTDWAIAPMDTTIIIPHEFLLAGFNGLVVKYEPCSIACGTPMYFEYMAYLLLGDSLFHYSPVPEEYSICEALDSVFISNIYCPAFNPLSGYFFYRVDYLDGETGIPYYASNWDTLAAYPEDYSFLITELGDTIFNVIPSSPKLAVNKTPDNIDTKIGDYIIISMKRSNFSIVITEDEDTLTGENVSPVSQFIWHIISPITLQNPIPDNITCKNDSSWLYYHVNYFIPDGKDTIETINLHWSPYRDSGYSAPLRLLDSVDFFNFEILFEEGYSYHQAIRANHFNTYDTFYFAVEFVSKFSSCPSVYDTVFVVARDRAPLPAISQSQRTCDSIYEIVLDSIVPGFHYSWRMDSALSCPADTDCSTIYLNRGDSTWRYVRTMYPNPAHCSSPYVPIQVSRYGDLSPGTIVSGQKLYCVDSEADPILSDTLATAGYGTINYRWLVDGVPIENSDNPNFTPADSFMTMSGVYTFTRQVQDGCLRGWEDSKESYMLYITSFSHLEAENNEDVTLCYGNAIPTITFDATLGNFCNRERLLWWHGTADSLTPPNGIAVANLEDREATITVSGTPTESGDFYFVLMIPNPIVCGPDFYDTIHITVHPELNGGIIEPIVQYTSTNLTLIPIENTLSANGGIGTNAYRWQYSLDSIYFYEIANRTEPIFTTNTPASTDFVLRRSFANECGTVYSNIINVNYVTVEIEQPAVTLRGRIASSNGDYVDEQGKRKSYSSLSQYGEKLTYNPYVITNAVSQVTSSTAKFTGAILFDGYTGVSEKGFEISTNATFTENLIRYNNVTDLTNTYTFDITELPSQTAYFVRAYATNNIGTSYGQTIPFTTK